MEKEKKQKLIVLLILIISFFQTFVFIIQGEKTDDSLLVQNFLSKADAPNKELPVSSFATMIYEENIRNTSENIVSSEDTDTLVSEYNGLHKNVTLAL